MAKVSFIGLGNMGLPMAQNLANAGHDVSGFDALPAACQVAKDAGIKIDASNSDVAKDAEVVILMLPNGQIVKEVGAEVLAALTPGSLLIDCSTVDVSSARDLHEMAKTADVNSLDAPVSGGVGGAAGGTLTFMVGGSAVAFDNGAAFFEIMGQKAVHCGEGGSGQAAKICNNMLLGISMIATGEAFALAEKLGLSQTALFDVVSTSSGSCWSVNSYCPVPGVGPQSPADNDYKAGFAAALMLKDMGFSQQASQSVSAATPLGEHATRMYQDMVDQGQGNTDFSAIIHHLQSK